MDKLKTPKQIIEDAIKSGLISRARHGLDLSDYEIELIKNREKKARPCPRKLIIDALLFRCLAESADEFDHQLGKRGEARAWKALHSYFQLPNSESSQYALILKRFLGFDASQPLESKQINQSTGNHD